MSETRRNKNQKITFWLPHFHWQVVISYEVLDVSVSFWKLWSTRAKWPSKILARPMSKISNKVELFSKKRKVFKKMVNSVFSGQTSFPWPCVTREEKVTPIFLAGKCIFNGQNYFYALSRSPPGRLSRKNQTFNKQSITEMKFDLSSNFSYCSRLWLGPILVSGQSRLAKVRLGPSPSPSPSPLA